MEPRNEATASWRERVGSCAFHPVPVRRLRAQGGDAGLPLSRAMEKTSAVSALSALAHDGRLDIFRLLVRAGPDGMAAGEIARATDTAASTLSANLAILSRAGLIASRRDGRSIIYAAAYDRMTHLLGYLLEDCCAGSPEICTPLAGLLAKSACCAGKPEICAPLAAIADRAACRPAVCA